MEPILALSLDHSRTYVALLEGGATYPSVAYINATSGPVEINQGVLQGEEYLDEVLLEIAGAAANVAIALPMEYAFVHQFPFPEDATEDAIDELVQLELQSHFAEHNVQDLEIRILPLAPRLDQRRLVAVVMIEKSIVAVLKRIAEKAFGALVHYDIAQNAAHAAFRYHYPEFESKHAVVIHLQQEYLDITALRHGIPVIYHLKKAAEQSEHNLKAIQEVIEEVLSAYLPFLDGVAIFGERLTRSFLSELQQLVHKVAPGAKAFRLNPFRYLTTTLGDRERAYCARTAHLFVPCIGVAIARQVQEQEAAV